MQKIIRGKIQGNTIQLEENPGFAEGQEVVGVVSAVGGKPDSENGLWRCAGALADEWTEEDDRILHEIYMDRKRDTRRDIPE